MISFRHRALIAVTSILGSALFAESAFGVGALPPGGILIAGVRGAKNVAYLSVLGPGASTPTELSYNSSDLLGTHNTGKRSNHNIKAINSVVISPSGQQFYSNFFAKEIVTADKDHSHERLLYVNEMEEIQNLVLDDAGYLYFSIYDSAGARRPYADGLVDAKIFRIKISDPKPKKELYCSIHLPDLKECGGNSFWCGSFAFAKTDTGAVDTKTLYLASGNEVPGSVYRMDVGSDKAFGKPRLVFNTRGRQPQVAVESLVIQGPDEAYFVSGLKVYSLKNWRLEQLLIELKLREAFTIGLLPK